MMERIEQGGGTTLRERTLRHPGTGKVWTTRCHGAEVEVQAGAAGTMKTKTFADDLAALMWVEKEERSRLRKGFVLTQPQARPGEPRMLIHLGDGHTGALVVSPLDGGLLCNRHVSGGEAAAGHDQLVRVGPDAGLTSMLDLPEHQLAWEACSTGSTGPVLLNVDHQIRAWNPTTTALRRLSEPPREPASFLSLAGSRAAWYADGEVVVHDFASRQDVFRHPLTPQLYGGHTSQMAGALSPDGKRLACCAKAGEIRWFDIATGTALENWRQDFEMIERMQFSVDGRWLFASETYGGWRLLRFDAASGQSSHAPGIDMARGDFAVEPTEMRLAVAARGQVLLFDGARLEELVRFRVDQVARTFRLAWMDANAIGVRTDLGFAGIYAI